jgi:hypothetical protein
LNILFIPHVPNLSVINRVYEFAKNTDSYFLYWEIDNSSLKHKIISQLRSFRFYKKEKFIQIPVLFKPEKFAIKLNTFVLNRLIDKLRIDVIVNANALLFDIASIKVPVIYDLVDDHLEVNLDIGLTKKRIEKIKNDIKNSVGVICVSHFLEDKVKLFNSNTITIENGVYIKRFIHAKSLKRKLNLEGKLVFGYIGGIHEWTGLREAIENYLKIKNKNNAFLVVGGNDGGYYRSLVEQYNSDVVFVGRVAPENVAEYFKTIDIGLIPFRLNPFTNNALPIKALEYALAGANVISTPLTYLKYKNFPFVKFSEIENFYKCMNQDFENINFDFSQYEWEVLSTRLHDFIIHTLCE